MTDRRLENEFIEKYRLLPPEAQREVGLYLRGLSDPRTRELTMLLLKQRLADRHAAA